jgi:hypothetical protein
VLPLIALLPGPASGPWPAAILLHLHVAATIAAAAASRQCHISAAIRSSPRPPRLVLSLWHDVFVCLVCNNVEVAVLPWLGCLQGLWIRRVSRLPRVLESTLQINREGAGRVGRMCGRVSAAALESSEGGCTIQGRVDGSIG